MHNDFAKQTHDASERSTAIINALNKAIKIFASHSEKKFDDVMSNGISPVADLVGLNRVAVYRFSKEDGRLGRKYVWAYGKTISLDEELIEPAKNPLPVTRWLEVLMAGNCINACVSDMTEDEAAFLSLSGIKSIFFVPVFMYEDFWGVVTLEDHTNYRYFDEDYLDMLRSVAYICANVVIRDEKEREVAEKNEFSRVLFETAPIGVTTFDDSFNFIDCNDAILTIYGVTKQYYIAHFLDLSPEYQPDGLKSRDEAIKIMERALKGEKLTVEWMHCTPAGELIPCEVTLTRTKQGKKYIGLAYVYDLRKIKGMEKSIQWLKSEADKAYYDALTEVYNRRYFDETLNHLIKSLSRSNGMLSLMMIDIDYFKKYNDIYGHSQGDNCLKIVAEVLSKAATRTDDFIARYGGEEFVIVLPNTGGSGACTIAERLLENIQDCNLRHESSDAANCVTVSIGVVTGKVDHTHNGNDYVERADEMLYISKRNGRNRYTFGSF